MSKPHHLEPTLVGLVFVGGMVGTTGRYLLTTALPSHGGWPMATFTENVVGSFLLGALLEALLRRGRESARGRRARLALGTGVLGGFTTFSSLALDVEQLLTRGSVAIALGYAAATVVVGLAACLLGVIVAARHHRWRHERTPPDPGRVTPSARVRGGRP
ncbi:MAG: fluoride efflux transporter FluC [Cellulomonas sp.]